MAEKSVSEMSQAEYERAKENRLRAKREEPKPAMLLTEEEYRQARRRLAGNPR